MVVGDTNVTVKHLKFNLKLLLYLLFSVIWRLAFDV
jgi:hypothetical protein